MKYEHHEGRIKQYISDKRDKLKHQFENETEKKSDIFSGIF